MSSRSMEYTFFWSIENYSYCWHRNAELLVAPEFTTDGLDGTCWFLELFPRGETDENVGSISLFLTRSKNDDGPENFLLKYELSILSADGLSLCTRKGAYIFQRADGHGEAFFVQMDEVLVRRKSEYLPHDTLNVRCKMWWGEGPIQKIGQCYARTRIAVKKISFLHLVKDFSTLEPNQRNTAKVGSCSKEGYVISSSVYCTDSSCCAEKIMVEITSDIRADLKSPDIKFLPKCKLSLLNVSGNIIECSQVDNRYDVVQSDIVKLSLALTRKVIIARKSEYLTDDKLSLLCECIFSPGLEFQRIEEIVYEIPVMAAKFLNNHKSSDKLPECFNALDDLKAIYNNQFLADIELKTQTTSFSAHKIILCARSSVFKTMLSSDMKEKNCDCIKIEDLDGDILKRLLLFLYCDNLEDLQWETATKLYYAADKYEVRKLKVVCSKFLEENLTTSTATELLLLADTHSDYDLKQVVEDFILMHDVEVFGSHEWENLIETNPQLALRTMHLKYKIKK